jgi:hypothetical protein
MDETETEKIAESLAARLEKVLATKEGDILVLKLHEHDHIDQRQIKQAEDKLTERTGHKISCLLLFKGETAQLLSAPGAVRALEMRVRSLEKEVKDLTDLVEGRE